MGKTYGQALAWLAATFPDREALVFKDRRYSFADVKAEVDRASARLGSLGLVPDDKVAIWLPNRPEFLFYWLGAAQMGLVAVMLNTRLRRDEVAYQIAQSDSRAAIVPGAGAFRDFLGDLAELCPAVRDGRPGELDCPDLPELRHVVALDPPRPDWRGVWDWSQLPSGPSTLPPLATDPEAAAVIAYSSGTTALPKGAMLTHAVWRKAADHGDRFEQSPDDRLYLCVPLFSILSTVNGVLTFWSRGSAVVLDDRFDSAVALETIARERCTAAYLLPLMIDRMLEHPDFASHDISSLRTGIVVSTAREALTKAVERLGMRDIFTSYGMTETSSACTRTHCRDPIEVRLETHGKPLPDIEVRVADPDSDKVLPEGETGELQVRGYNVMLGYYKKPEETARAFTADGWFKTGDAGLMLPDGAVKFLRRLSDGYKHKGFNVSTAEVEAAIASHPTVEETAVFGLPDASFGEVGVAFVVPRAGETIDMQDLAEHLKPRLASFKQPAHVFLIDELPRTAGTEKVQKFKLRELALQRLEEQAPAQ